MNNPEYYGHPRREMIPFVPESTRTLLDIGCGAGAFAAGLKQSRGGGQDLEIVGVEMCQEAARLANEVMDQVLTGDFLTVFPQLQAGHFDCIVLNDVLEHVVQPEEILGRLRSLLTPEGVLVISIPNVRHFFNVLDLVVHGRWDYTDEGILDRTHLRFYTRSSIRNLIQENGFRVDTMVGINPTGSLKFKLVNLLTLGRWSDMKYLQFAIKASPRN